MSSSHVVHYCQKVSCQEVAFIDPVNFGLYKEVQVENYFYFVIHFASMALIAAIKCNNAFVKTYIFVCYFVVT
jgi:hypothetical protein